MPHRSVSGEIKGTNKVAWGDKRDSPSARRDKDAQHDGGAIQEFLDEYAEAMTSGDVKTLAALWEAPAFVIDTRNVIPVTNTSEVEKFFEGAKDQYNAMGITSTTAEIEHLDWVSDDLVVARVRWPYENDAGKVMGAESSSYTLRRSEDGDWKIRAVMMRGVEQPPGVPKQHEN